MRWTHRFKYLRRKSKLKVGKYRQEQVSSTSADPTARNEGPTISGPMPGNTILKQDASRTSIEGSAVNVLGYQTEGRDIAGLKSNANSYPSLCLWEEAMNQLTEEDTSPWDAIRQSMSSNGTVVVVANIHEEIDRIIESAKQRQQKENGWHFEFQGRTIYIRDLTRRVLDWVNKFKECIDVAVSFDPVHAALPWAAIRFLIIAVTADNEQSGLLLVILEDITRIITRCRIYEELYVDPLDQEQNCAQLRDALRRLYMNILKDLSLTVKLCERHSIGRAMHAIMNPGEVSGLLGKLDRLENDVMKESDLCERKYSRQVSRELGGQYSILRKLLEQTLTLQIEEKVTGLTDLQLAQFCDWLRHTNPSARYNEMLKVHQHETSSWIFPTREWQDWYNQAPNTSRSLWVHGIPGSGKSVLAAYIIDMLKKKSQESGDNELCIFYFCYFAHEQDETSPMLRWMASQLCQASKQIPAQIKRIYQQRLEPTEEDLLTTIEIISSHWTRVFLVVDALDESSQPWSELTDVLRRLATEPRFGNVWMLTTSREYDDIKNKMREFSTSISMSNVGLEDDIKKFVQHNLRMKPDKRFKSWPESLIDEVESHLIHESRGMFQWAKCQIDYLGRLRDVNKIREALKTLPPTLYDTYDRIISLIPEDDIEFTRRALHWVSYATIPGTAWLRPKVLLIASIPTLDVNRYTYREEHILDLCGCLLREEGGMIVSAHFTVHEYLQSARIPTPYASLAMKPSLNRDMTVDMLQRLLQLGSTSTSLEDDHIEDYIFLCSRQLHAGILVRELFANMDSEMERLIIQVLNPSLPHYDLLFEYKHATPTILNTLLTYPTEESRADPVTTDAILVGNCISMCLLPLAAKLLDEKGPHILERVVKREKARVNGRSNNGRSMIESVLESLSFTLWRFSRDPFIFLLDRFDTFCRMVDKRKSLGYYILRHREDHRGGNCQPECRLKRLLSIGASPDSSSLDMTPLQIAVINRDVAAVELLLQEGANPNARSTCVLGARSWIYYYDEDVKGGYGKIAGNDVKELRGLSPLSICFIMLKSSRTEEEQEFSAIADLLVEYGGIGLPFDDGRHLEDHPEMKRKFERLMTKIDKWSGTNHT